MLVITTDGEVLDGKSSLTGREIAAVVLLREDGSEDLKERLEVNIFPRMGESKLSAEKIEAMVASWLRQHEEDGSSKRRIEYVDFGYGLKVSVPTKLAPLDENGNPCRDNKMEDARIAAKLLSLLCGEEDGRLKSQHAIVALELARDQILLCRTWISQEAPLPSIFDSGSHIESPRRSSY